MGSTLKNPRLIFYLLWLALAILQASLTELQDDEAYYWVYSKFPDWGYYDHPPMIAMLVKAGYAILPNELGIRLFPVLMNIGTLLIIEKLTDQKNPFLYFVIALSMVVLQLGGFLAVPDIPLIFFTAVFFYFYRRFLNDQNTPNSLLLGLTIAFLFYSKYHGLLIVLFSVLSNPGLFRKKYLYVAAGFALLLFLPHLWWQYRHEWVSFRYHLFESNVHRYKLSYTSEYLIGQVLMMGPVAGFILFPAALNYKPRDFFEKALRFTMIGILVFFLLSTLRGRVEANWTTPALIAMMILSHHSLQQRGKWNTLLFKLLPLSLIVAVFGRIAMIEDIIPVQSIRERYHAWDRWPQEMKIKTQGLPVVFGNYYQYASKYWFYTGQVSFAQSFYKVRKNNYNYWPVEDSVFGKKVYVLDKHRLHLFPNSIKTPLGFIGYKYDSCFPSFSKLKIHADKKKYSISRGEKVHLICDYEIPDKYKTFIATRPYPPDSIRVGVFNRKGWVTDLATPLRLSDLMENQKDTITITPLLPPGKYIMRIALNVGSYYPAHSSDNLVLLIK